MRHPASGRHAYRDRATAHVPGCTNIKTDDQLTSVLRRFRKGLTDRNLAAAIELYSDIRTYVIEPAGNDSSSHRHSRRSQRASQLLKLGDFRAFHIFLSRSASKAQTQEAAAKLYGLVIQTVDDMRQLGFRVGATEIAEYVCARNRLEQHAKSINVWRESVAVTLRGSGQADSAAQKGLVRHLYPKTHVYALGSAVALKDPGVVREVYDGAMRSMEMSRSSKDNPPKTPPKPTLSLFRSIFRTPSKRARGVAVGTTPVQSSSGLDRVWDPARLGSGFLARVYDDAQRWVGSECELLPQIGQHILRALLLEGNAKRAIQLYESLSQSNQNVHSQHETAANSNAAMTAGILCELVGGLCRLSRADAAYSRLIGAEKRYRSVAVWNVYFDGLYQFGNRNSGSQTGDPLERLRQAIRKMEEFDAIEPDVATRSIWMRACFRSGQWKNAAACFRTYSDLMCGDVVCWDILIRGMLGSDDPEAHKEGWELVGQLTMRRLVPQPTIDARLVETILLHLFARLNGSPASASAPDEDAIMSAATWAESNVSLDRKNTHAIIIGSLLRAGQIDGALEIHKAMRSRGFWPTRSINCMIVKALASQPPQIQQSHDVAEFIETCLPPQHLAAAYAIVLKLALGARNYEYAWSIMDKHYPEVSSSSSLAASEQQRQSNSSSPFPNATMYHTALQMTKAHGDPGQHRRVLDRMESHLDLMHGSHQAASKRIALLFNQYKHNHR
ncbi:hypothetical protein GQ54DRAFT_288442 [Martensiomyces pterosporus]|nr:hypothetical protein GQ54DRAFT_288442 [Martensiomyces pterosporus]